MATEANEPITACTLKVYRGKYPDPTADALLPEFVNKSFSGLTKREWFAAMAMQGAATKAMNFNDLNNMAIDAVHAADCLIEELNKPII
jgi:hypothetical protein